MKIVPALLLLVFLATGACKKDEPAKEPQTEQPVTQTGELKIRVTTVNGIGDTIADNEGVKVTLQTGATATTDAQGVAVFPDLPYGSYAPSLLRTGYEGPPVAILLQNSAQLADLPLVKHSDYKLNNLQCQAFTANVINLYFNVNMPIPSGKVLKIAVLTHSAAPTAASYSSADLITTNTETVSALNIADLPDLKAYLKTIVQGSVFYITAVPVSYGLYKNNITVKPSLLGESVYAYSTIQLIKNW